MGVYRKVQRHVEPDPLFVSNSILVAKGQSQQEYRFCGNYVEANARVHKPAAPLPDCAAIVDALQNCTFMSAVDIRSGF